MAVQLEIRGFSSTDVGSLKHWHPSAREDVFIPLCVEVAEKGKPGGNLFQMVIATPEGIRKFGEKYGEIPDRNLLVCLDYRWDEIEKRIAQIVASCAKETWAESMQSLQRFFQWEYES